jgi:hypothetical protein
VLTGVAGVRNGARELPQAVTGGQRLATALELGYGVASWAALAALWTRPTRARLLLYLWAALLAATAAAASVAWGGAGIAAALAAGAAVAVFCALILWLALWRPKDRPPDTNGETR